MPAPSPTIACGINFGKKLFKSVTEVSVTLSHFCASVHFMEYHGLYGIPPIDHPGLVEDVWEEYGESVALLGGDFMAPPGSYMSGADYEEPDGHRED